MSARQELLEAIKLHSGMGEDEIKEAGRYGADTGWPGFTYTSDAADFYRDNSNLIDELLQESADSFGYANVGELVATFTRADMTDTRDRHDNLLAWFALESVGSWLENREEEEEE